MRRPAALALAAALAGCSRAPFALTSCDLGPDGAAKLDQPLTLHFDDELDDCSATAIAGALRIVRERDESDVPFSARTNGTALVLLPRLPTKPTREDGGLAPGESYRLELFGTPRLRTLRGRELGPLVDGTQRRFRTVALDAANGGARDLGAVDAELLYVDPVPGPPQLDSGRRARFEKDGRIVLVFSEPLDPAPLARARFWFGGPWSQESRATEDPLLEARLVENQERAVVELSLAAPPPSPIQPKEQYWVRIEPKLLRDFGGHELARQGTPEDPIVKLERRE